MTEDRYLRTTLKKTIRFTKVEDKITSIHSLTFKVSACGGCGSGGYGGGGKGVIALLLSVGNKKVTNRALTASVDGVLFQVAVQFGDVHILLAPEIFIFYK